MHIDKTMQKPSERITVLVTGANGQLGREMRRAAAGSKDRYVFTDVTELDIADADAVGRTVREEKADVIVNCAAYTNVDRAEEDETAADLLNHRAVANLAAAARERGAVLIHISTDYVFRGDKSTPYAEDDPTDPTGAYGRTKLAGERTIAESGCRYLIFRTAWLYSEFGNNFLRTMLRLTAERDSLSVVLRSGRHADLCRRSGPRDLRDRARAEIRRPGRAYTTSPTKESARGTTSPERSPGTRAIRDATSGRATARSSPARSAGRASPCWTKPR